MSRQPGMKLTLQLHRPRKCLERTCWQEWVFSNNEQSNPWTFHQGIPLDEMNSVAGDALEIPARCRPTEVEYSPGGCASPQSREVYTSLDICTAPKKRLLSYKVAATKLGVILCPYSIREMRYIIRPIWSGCIRKKISLNLLQLVVEEWVLMMSLYSKGWSRVCSSG